MKYILSILFLIFVVLAVCTVRVAANFPIPNNRDTIPTGVPQLFGGKYYKFNGYVLADSLLMTKAADTIGPVYFPALKFKVTDGRWYGYDLNRWQKFLWPGDTVSLSNRINSGWRTDGNNGTDISLNFLGTTDNVPLAFRTNNTERIRITEGGDIGINTQTPGTTLHVEGTLAVTLDAGIPNSIVGRSGFGGISTLFHDYGLIIDGGVIRVDTTDIATQYDLTQASPALPNMRVAFGSPGNIITSEAAYYYDSSTNTLYVDTIKLKNLETDTVLFRPKIIAPRGDSAAFFGNSITEGSNADPIGDSAYVPITANYYGKPFVNRGESGSGAQVAIALHNQYIIPHHSNFVVVMTGYNSVRQGGNNQETFQKILNAYKAIFVNNYLHDYVPASSSQLTRSGSWTTSWDASAAGGKSVNSGAFTTTINNYIEYSFTGTNVCFAVFAGDGSGGVYSPSNIEVLIDNVSIETLSLIDQTDGIADLFNPSMDGKLVPYTRYYTGLSEGAHTIRVVNKQSGFMLFDYFGTLVRPEDGNTLVFMHPPYSNPTGYAVSPSNGSDAAMDSVANKLDSLAAELAPYPVYIGNTTQYLNAHSDLSSDSIHPNNTGHRHIFNAIQASVGSSPIYRDGQVLFANGHLWVAYNGELHQLIDREPIYKDGQFSGDTLRMGTTNSQKVGIISNGVVVATFDQTGFNGLEMSKSIRTGDAYLAAGEIQLKNTIAPASGVLALIGRMGGRPTFMLNRDQFGPTPNANIWTLNINANALLFQANNDAGDNGNSFLGAYRNPSSPITFDSTVLYTKINFHDTARLDARFSYSGNYHASFTPFSLVTKKYADSVAAKTVADSLGARAIESGTYTATLTGVTNVDGTTFGNAHYYRSGNYCTVWITLTVDPTATGSTEVGISLPFASSIEAGDIMGHGNCTLVLQQTAVVASDAGNDRANMFFTATDLASQAFYLSFSYKITPP